MYLCYLKTIGRIRLQTLDICSNLRSLMPFFCKYAQIQKSVDNLIESKPESKPEEGPLTNKVIVLSDFKTATLTKKEFTKQLTDLGAIVEDNITKNTNILINGDPLKESTKVKKAKTQPQTTILTFELKSGSG